MGHEAEILRCLLHGDVVGIRKVWAHAAHLASLDAAESLIALHMARIEAKSVPRKLKLYSLGFLDERGFRKVDGKWIQGQPTTAVVSEAAAIASRSKDPALSQKIVQAMSDAYLESLAKGVLDPPAQKERMLKARDKVRFKQRLA